MIFLRILINKYRYEGSWIFSEENEWVVDKSLKIFVDEILEDVLFFICFYDILN